MIINEKSPDALRLSGLQITYYSSNFHNFVGRIRRASVASDINKAHFSNNLWGNIAALFQAITRLINHFLAIFLGERAFLRIWQNFQHDF